MVPRAEADDPIREFAIGRAHPVAVDLKEGQHRDQRRSLVAVDERLRLRDAVRKHRRLEREIGLLVVGVEVASSGQH